MVLIRESKHNKDARLMLGSFIIFFMTIVYDILLSRNIIALDFLENFGILSPYGLFFFVAAIAIILANDFVRLHKEVEVKGKDLLITLNERDEAYRDLKEAYKEIEIQSINLKQTLHERDLAYKKIDTAYIETMHRMAVIAELRDPETGAHIKRVSIYVRILAEKLGYEMEFVTNMYYAAPMHDVGKVGIPDRILLKEGPLTPEEWKIMKAHTTIGGKIFESAESVILRLAKDIALSHHEKWDGSGYPYGLKGNEIPLSGRLMALADIYDALRSKRPYKQELPHEKVLNIMVNGDERLKPTGFDPIILEAFIKHAGLFDEAYQANKD
jgi:putative two-component system response regulator